MKENLLEILTIAPESEREVLLRKYIDQNPRDLIAYLKLGDIVRGRNPREATRIHLSIIYTPKIDKKLKKMALKSLIKDSLQDNNVERAIFYAKEILKIDSRDIETYEILYKLYEEVENWEGAVHTFDELRKIRKQKSDMEEASRLYALWGKSLLDKGEDKKGLDKIKESLKIKENSFWGLLYLGEYHRKRGELDKCIEVWEKLLFTYPDKSHLILEKLEEVFYESGQYDKMEDLYKRFLNEYQDNEEASVRFARILLAKGETERALNILSAIKNNFKAKRELIKLLIKNGEIDKALQELETLEPLQKFICKNCKRIFDEFSLKCPQCKSWLTIEPIS